MDVSHDAGHESQRPQLHIFGHIHDGYGMTISDEIPGATFLNASICTEAYRPSNPPHQVALGESR